MQKIQYQASRTGAKFHASDAFVRGIMGPVGSGKSVMCVTEILKRAYQQKADANGRRRSRWAVVRNTYPELKATTIKTWSDWVPESICPIVYGAPITGHMETRLKDGTILDLEVLFLALDKMKDQKKLLSLELTGAWFNEVREIPKPIVDAMLSRVGRFPSKRDGGSKWIGVIMDTNPPDDLHWYYHLAEEDTPAGWEFFRQPGGLIRNGDQYSINPDAENLEHLEGGGDYYMRQVSGTQQDYINVMLCAEYGSLFDGKPVYRGAWNEQIHVSREPLEYLPNLPLLLGWDFGRTPACIVGQGTASGQLRILNEFYSDNSGIRQFAENVVKPQLALMYPGYTFESFGDPAGAAKGQTSEESCLSELDAAGLRTIAASTNDPLMRKEAVIKALGRLTEGVPGFLIDSRCKMLIRGFNGGYHYQVVGKLMGGGEIKYAEAPVKNMYSHPHDALQYLALGFNPEAIGARRQVDETIRRTIAQQKRQEYNPLDY